MTNVFCVRAEFGTYTKHFVAGGYVAIDIPQAFQERLGLRQGLVRA